MTVIYILIVLVSAIGFYTCQQELECASRKKNTAKALIALFFTSLHIFNAVMAISYLIR